MRRWVIVILALQFFCSMSALAYGQGRIGVSFAESDISVISVISVTDEESKAVQHEHLSVLNAEHDLHDAKPDLPECLNLTWNHLLQADSRDMPLALASPDWTPPTLAGLQRPPQT